MKKILTALGFFAILLSCSSTQEVDLYKDYKAKHDFIGKKITSKSTNKEILASEELRQEIFDRSNRKFKKDLKGVWVATVVNLDFPKTFSAQSQKEEIDKIVENVKNWGLNAIFFHVRPSADALYQSEYEPWSIYLTKEQDKHPGYDPLEYFIKKAHENNIELHAWINPYRAAMNTNLDNLSEKSVVKKHPEWIFEFEGKYYMNPGNPEVVDYVSKAIEELVAKYDIDGLHIDDYFYPYPMNNQTISDNIDDKEYMQYGQAYANKYDWRRDNVNNMIKNLSVSVHKIKPNILFGVSPFGIWRNIKNDVRGSYTSGLQSYDSLYADSLKWMSEGWIDYIAPQIYWEIGHPKADYETLVKWWAKKSKETKTPVYVGHSVYKYMDNNFKDPKEIEKQLKLIKQTGNIDGSIFFRYESLLNNPYNVLDQIK